MKKYFSSVILSLTIFAFSAHAKNKLIPTNTLSAHGQGNGGDTVRLAFHQRGEIIGTFLKGIPVDRLPVEHRSVGFIPAQALHQIMTNIDVYSTSKLVFCRDERQELVEKDACYCPAEGKALNQARVSRANSPRHIVDACHSSVAGTIQAERVIVNSPRWNAKSEFEKNVLIVHESLRALGLGILEERVSLSTSIAVLMSNPSLIVPAAPTRPAPVEAPKKPEPKPYSTPTYATYPESKYEFVIRIRNDNDRSVFCTGIARFPSMRSSMPFTLDVAAHSSDTVSFANYEHNGMLYENMSVDKFQCF